MRQFFVDALLQAGETAELLGGDFVHLTRSLRARVGEPVRMVDRNFRAFMGTLVAVDRRAATLRADLLLPVEPDPAPLALGLCVPATDAFDASLDSAVQLGATDFVPLISGRSRALDAAKMPRWERIARESCCQSLRTRPPRLAPPQSLESFLKASREGEKMIACQDGKAAAQKISRTRAMTLLVGPEGGFEEAELELARSMGWRFLGLGPHVLRVPVAVAAGLGVLQQMREA